MYSESQMDDFYFALSKGNLKASGIMNYIQHAYIAQQITAGEDVLEACCGRGLILPLINRYANTINSYVGVDISIKNLDEANNRLIENVYPFPIEFVQGDVSELTNFIFKKFDVIIYTSSIEHMPKEYGLKSLIEVAKILKADGRLYLSTPRTRKELGSNKLQYKVHIYEWDFDEMYNALDEVGLKVEKVIGLLPEINPTIEEAKKKFGEGAAQLINKLLSNLPPEFCEPVIAAAFPESAKEIMYICKK